MSNYLSDKYSNLSPYVPGEQPKEREYIKLNTNESPFAPSALAVKMAMEEVGKCNLYSDPECKELVSTIAEYYGVSNDMVIVGNGSDEVLNFAFMAYCDKNTPAVFADITYGFYKVFAQINNVGTKIIPLKQDFSIDVNDYFNANGTVFIANPNAPTGISLSIEEIEQVLKNNPNNVVVIDQAYVDFGGESAVQLVNKYNNLLVTMTFSKSRSLAGARLGMGIACPTLIEDLNRVRNSLNPYNVNKMTLKAGVGAIKDDKYFQDNVKTIIENREYLMQALAEQGFKCLPSKSNFVFASHKKISGENLYKQLKDKGVLVRHFKQERIKDYVRITIGTIEQMNALIKAIKQILED